MNNKYLVTIIIPENENTFDIYIPNNKKIGTIKNKIINYLFDINIISVAKDENNIRFIDKDTGIEFNNNLLVKDSGIKNGTKIIIL